MDANNNGIPDEDEVEEGFDADSKVGSEYTTSKGNKVTKTEKGLKHERPSSTYDDGGDDIDTNAKSGKGVKSHAKSQSAAEKKEKAPAQKKSKTGTWGMEGGEKFDNRKKEESIAEAKGKCCCEEKGKTKCPVHSKVEEAAKPTPFDKSQYDGDREEPAGSKSKPHPKGHLNKMLRKKLGEPEKKVDEGKPSAGLSKAKKSAVVKDAKAGKDIGKPGKSFDKVAKAAGGGEKGQKIAAAAMWKNMKETVAYMAEKKAVTKDLPGNQEKIDVAEPKGKIDGKDMAALRAKKETVKESTDFTRMQEQISRLNRNEHIQLNENSEVNTLRKLSNLFKG
jgi:hypothetical protein